MPKYHVLLKAVVNVRYLNVEADSPLDAVQKTEDLFYKEDHPRVGHIYHADPDWDTAPDNTLAYTEFAAEINQALVDEPGDEWCERSKWFEWSTIGAWEEAK